MSPSPHAVAKIVVTRANPSRGEGYQVAHFLIRSGQVLNVWQRDNFHSSLSRAARWVARNYPEATLRTICQNRAGELAGFCFECTPSRLRRRAAVSRRSAARMQAAEH